MRSGQTATGSDFNRSIDAASSAALDLAIAGIVGAAATFVATLQRADGSSRDAFRQLVAIKDRTPATTPSVAGLLKAILRGLKAAAAHPGIRAAQKALTLENAATIDRVLALHTKAASELDRKLRAPREVAVNRRMRPTANGTLCWRATGALRPTARRTPGDHQRRLLRVVVVDQRSMWKMRRP